MKFVLAFLALFSTSSFAATTVVASSNVNRVFIHYNQPTTEITTLLAMNECRKYATDCKIVSEVGTRGYFGLGVCSDGRFLFVHNGRSEEQAIRGLLMMAKSNGYELNQCRLIKIGNDVGGHFVRST